MATLEQGRIVWAELPSSDGTQKKRRPAVIVTPTDEIVAGKPIMVVAATTKFTDPLPPDQVKLPWHPAGKVRTQLRQPTVAVCTWLFHIQEAEIHRQGGIVPPKVLLKIIEAINQKKTQEGNS